MKKRIEPLNVKDISLHILVVIPVTLYWFVLYLALESGYSWSGPRVEEFTLIILNHLLSFGMIHDHHIEPSYQNTFLVPRSILYFLDAFNRAVEIVILLCKAP
jgi:hypothetical protein